MSTVPSFLLIETKEPGNLSARMLYVILKQLFRFGVKDIKIRGERGVLVSLTYSPRGETLRKKLGNLPVNCTRLNLDSECDLHLLEEAVMKFQFNIGTDESMAELEGEPALKKIKWNEEDEEEKKKKKKEKPKIFPSKSKITILDQKIFTSQPTPTQSTSEIVTVFDDDAEFFNAQKYHFELK